MRDTTGPKPSRPYSGAMLRVGQPGALAMYHQKRISPCPRLYDSADIRQLAAFAKVLAKRSPTRIPARGRRALASGNLTAKIESAGSLCLDKELAEQWSDCVSTTGISQMPIEADDLVDEVMRSRPTTIRVFL